MCVQLRMTLKDMDAPSLGTIWVCGCSSSGQTAAGLNGPENSVKEQAGQRGGFKY